MCDSLKFINPPLCDGQSPSQASSAAKKQLNPNQKQSKQHPSSGKMCTLRFRSSALAPSGTPALHRIAIAGLQGVLDAVHGALVANDGADLGVLPHGCRSHRPTRCTPGHRPFTGKARPRRGLSNRTRGSTCCRGPSRGCARPSRPRTRAAPRRRRWCWPPGPATNIVPRGGEHAEGLERVLGVAPHDGHEQAPGACSSNILIGSGDASRHNVR